MDTEPPADASRPLALDRRTLFRSGLLGAGLAVTPGALAAATLPGFAYGVASGEPGTDRVLLWTRYKADQATSLRWEVSATQDFRAIMSGGNVEAKADRDWCVKPVAEGLEPGRWYFYRFIAPDGTMSSIGRTRTLPVGKVDRFRMAVFSCSNIGFGWFNAYAHAADANAFDLLVHTGDYFYEYAPGTYPSESQAQAGRWLDPASETVSLGDYRLRHANYRRDPDLQRLTQVYPMILGWDDHESANDSWSGGAENHQPGSEGEWDVRKRAAMRAYREWLPVSGEPYAAYEIGDLASIFRLETRLLGRDEPPSLGAILAGKTSPEEAFAALGAFRDGHYVDPARTMLGMKQEAWLADSLKRSTASGRKWQVLAQQVIMGRLAASPALTEGMTADVPDFVRRRLIAAAAAAQAGLPLNMDAWDGYPAARERLLEASLEADANLVVLSGDSHNGWAFDLDHEGTAAGVEFAGHSVTSPGAESNLPWLKPADLAQQSVATNSQLAWADTSNRGYMAVELTPERATAEWRFLQTVRKRDTRLTGSHRKSALHGARRFEA